MNSIKLIQKIGDLGVRKKFVQVKDIGSSYNNVSDEYEQRFLKEMHVYNDKVLRTFVEVADGKPKRILDLACGTGYNSQRLARSYPDTTFCLVDISEGMLTQAREKQIEKAEYVHQDMLSFLRAQPDGSFDGVVCMWAIKYQPPKQVVREVHRVLKPGGIFGVLVNTKQTLPEIRKVYPKLLLKHSDKIQSIMRELPNPKDKKCFLKWFEGVGFKVITSEADLKKFNFKDSSELTAWVTHTGALAGFDCMIDLKDDQVGTTFKSVIEDKNINSVTHSFVWAILKK